MKHYYTTKRFGRENWFGWEPLYAEMIQRHPGGTFVELGSWKGRSTAFLAVEAINAASGIHIHAVDAWNDDIGGGAKKTMIQQGLTGNALYDCFLANIEPVSSIVTPMRMTTTQAASQFADESVDMVFIDADHSYDAVLRDIQIWRPKVKHGGILAGHDYNWAGSVQRAVHEEFGEADWRDPWHTGCFIAHLVHDVPTKFEIGC